MDTNEDPPQDARDVETIRLTSWGAVVDSEGVVPWLVVDEIAVPIEPIRRYLTDFVARGNSSGSVRSYAHDLLRWWRWLRVVGVRWDQATAAEVRDLVLWLSRASKPRRSPRTTSAATAGTVNPITRKRYLDDRYSARTIRHSNSVIRAFYEYWREIGMGPLVNPVPQDWGRRGGRANAHHNPLDTFRPEGRLRYNPKLPKQQPRFLTDPQWTDLFTRLRSNRDRALLSLVIGNGARASEILRLRPVDVDWGDQTVRVTRKGSGIEQWLPASAEAFVWLRLYYADLGDPPAANDPIWHTLRRRDRGAGLCRQPLNYEALRKVFTRANDALGTNWTVHDLRHTAAIRMSRDKHLSMRDVQTILGHVHLSTTVDTYLVEDQASIVRRVLRHLDNRQRQEAEQPPRVAEGYDPAALAVLLGEGFA